MECRTARERLLLAEPGELTANAPGALAEHLRTCGRCAAAAARIRAANAALATSLTPSSHIETPRLPVRRRRRGTAAAVLAAAAALVLLLNPGAERDAIGDADVASPASLPTVSVPPGHNAVVFRTADPKITVVWYY